MTSRIYYLEARNELLKFIRMKSYALSSLLFPLMFYCFFGLAMGPQAGAKTPMARYLLATYGAFAIMGSTLYAFGAGIAVERGLGWLEVKRASPMPAGAYLFAKAFASIVIGGATILMLFALGAAFGGVRMAPTQWALTFAALVAGAVPFCALGLIIGNLAGPNSAPATVNMIYMPLAFCGGLWLPFDFLPKAIQQIAPLLPSYHLAQIALAIQNAPVHGTIAGHAEALAAFACLFLGLAFLAQSHEREKMYG
ncbi:MAG: type transporter [Candidatus Solibacter sp.]|jgi:ABC-2 type transport system permease protein|nr:type transporter [Candidatus Solibacter sp.]